MVTLTFAVAAAALVATAVLFGLDILSAVTQTAGWMVVFFFASAAASSAYLTASEIFPLETRALAIASFYAAGTALGGTLAPWIFSRVIQTGSHWGLAAAYMAAAALMLVAAGMEFRFGVDDIAEPLASTA